MDIDKNFVDTTFKEVVDKWNNGADAANSWDNLGEDEKIAFAFKCGNDSLIALFAKAHEKTCVCDIQGEGHIRK